MVSLEVSKLGNYRYLHFEATDVLPLRHAGIGWFLINKHVVYFDFDYYCYYVVVVVLTIAI